MRLNADMIARSPAFFNAMKDRELDLRGELRSVPMSSALCPCHRLDRPRACASQRRRRARHTTRTPLSSPPAGAGNKIAMIENLAATQVPPVPARRLPQPRARTLLPWSWLGQANSLSAVPNAPA